MPCEDILVYYEPMLLLKERVLTIQFPMPYEDELLYPGQDIVVIHTLDAAVKLLASFELVLLCTFLRPFRHGIAA